MLNACDRDVITVEELDAMSDEEFKAVFPGGPALVSFIRSLQTPDLGPSCPDCLNLQVDCICDQLKERAS